MAKKESKRDKIVALEAENGKLRKQRDKMREVVNESRSQLQQIALALLECSQEKP